MALIKCPECGKEISSKAKMCIHCGYPMDEYKESQQETLQEEYDIYNPPLIEQKFQVIMTSYGINKNRVAEEMEDMKITSFDNAIKLFEKLPQCIHETYSYDESRKIKSSLSDIGADIKIKKIACQDTVKTIAFDTDLYCIQIPENENLPIDISEIRLNNRISSNIHYIDLLVTGLPLESAKLLYNILIQRNINCKLLKDSISENENVKMINYIKCHFTDDKIKCPKCGSTQITTGNKGYSLLTGFLGSNKTINRCARCGYSWEPRK